MVGSLPLGVIMKLVDVALVMLGAAVGGGLRYAVGVLITERWSTPFPWHTLVINLSGAFLLGILMALTVERGSLPASLILLLGTGVLGGFTTFSTLSYESVALMEHGLYAQGAVNMFGSAVGGIAAVVLGLLVGRAV
jgi:CrcB protein